MASKKEAEGISLLSMYGEDEDDDMDSDRDNNTLVLNNNEQTKSGADEAINMEEEDDDDLQSAHHETDVDQSQSDTMKYRAKESEPEEVVNFFKDGMKEMDIFLDKFLPLPPKSQCSNELQEKIIKFLFLKRKTGRSYNSEVRNRKEYRNPDFLLHAVTYQDIDQIGSCFSKDVFDPHGYDISDYYDEIEADLKRDLERKEQEKKQNQKIDFLSGGTQPIISIPTSKMVPRPPVASIAGGGSNSVSAAVDTGTREGRPYKKSKWDKPIKTKRGRGNEIK